MTSASGEPYVTRLEAEGVFKALADAWDMRWNGMYEGVKKELQIMKQQQQDLMDNAAQNFTGQASENERKFNLVAEKIKEVNGVLGAADETINYLHNMQQTFTAAVQGELQKVQNESQQGVANMEQIKANLMVWAKTLTETSGGEGVGPA